MADQQPLDDLLARSMTPPPSGAPAESLEAYERRRREEAASALGPVIERSHESLEDYERRRKEEAAVALGIGEPVARDERERVKGALFVGMDQNPDEASKIQMLARLLGTSPDVARESYQKLLKNYRITGDRLDAWLADPDFANFISNPENAAVAHDDGEPLLRLMSAVRNYVALPPPGLRAIDAEKWRPKVKALAIRLAREQAKRLDPALAIMEREFVGDRFLEQSYGVQITEASRAKASELEIRMMQQIAEDEKFIARADKIGAWESLTTRYDKNPIFALPLIGGIPESVAAVQLWQAHERFEAGNPTDEDMLILTRAARLEAAAERRGRTLMGGVTEILMTALPFAAEIAISKGLTAEKALTEATVKLGLSAALKATFRAVRSPRAIAAFLGDTARTVALQAPFRSATWVLPRMQGDVVLVPENDVVVVKMGKEGGEPWYIAVPRGVAAQYIEVGTESLGRLPIVGALEEAMGKVGNRLFFGWWLKRNPGQGLSAFQRALAKAEIHTAPTEILEEEVGKLAHAALGIYPYEFTTLAELGEQAVAFTIMPGAAAAANYVGEVRVDAVATRAAANALDAASAAVTESALARRDPTRVEGLIDSSVAGTAAETVYAPVGKWTTYWQDQGADPREEAERVLGPGGGDIYDESVRTGAPMPIDTGAYTVRVGATEHGKYWNRAVQAAPDAQSLEDIGEELRSVEEAAAKAEPATEPSAEEVEAQKVRRQSEVAVRNAIRAKLQSLVQAGVMNKGQARAYERYEASWWARLAAKADIDPLELYRRYPTTFSKEGVAIQANLPTEAFVDAMTRLREGQVPTAEAAYGPSLIPFLEGLGGFRAEGEIGELLRRSTPAAEVAGEEQALPAIQKPARATETGLLGPQISDEQAAQAAVQAGYIDAPEALRAALEAELAGQPVYSPGKVNQAVAAERQALLDLGDRMREIGLDPATADPFDAAVRLREHAQTRVKLLGDRIVRAIEAGGPDADDTTAGPPEVTTYYSVRNFEEWKRKTILWMEKNEYSKKEIDAHLKAIEGQFKILGTLGPMEVEMFPEGAGLAGKEGPIRTNSDFIYKVSFDASAMCVKRLEVAATAAYVQEKLRGRVLTTNERIALVALFRAAGKPAPCLICYVESGRDNAANTVMSALDIIFGTKPVPQAAPPGQKPKRATATREAEWSQKMVDMANEAILEANAKGLTRDDMNMNFWVDPEIAVSEEAAAFEAEYPAVHAFVRQQYYNAKANIPKLYEEYDGQILMRGPRFLWKSEESQRKLYEEINGYAGFRFFSSSDFQDEHVVDLMQAVFDLELREAKAHAYTKVVAFIEIFGDTNMKIMTSLFAKEDAKGNIIADTDEGMGWDDAKRLRKKHANVGNVFVATSDNQMIWALQQDWLDYIIPYHASGLPKEVRDELGWRDYTSIQTEEWAFPAEHEGETAEKVRMHEMDVAKGISNEEGTRRYLKLCLKRGLVPVFPRFLFKDAKAIPGAGPAVDEANREANVAAAERWREMVKSGKIDWSQINMNFFKVKKDFARTDTPFKPVEANIDLGAVEAAVKRYITGVSPRAIPDKAIGEQLIRMLLQTEAEGEKLTTVGKMKKWFAQAKPAPTLHGRCLWSPDFPEKIVIHTTLERMKAHADYRAAKDAGDHIAAMNVVEAVAKTERIRDLGKRHPGAYLVPVVGVEADPAGANAIPAAFAELISRETDLLVAAEEGIVRTNKTGHTGMNAADRFLSRARFDGGVVPGRRYILVDDYTTQGGTMNELRQFIEAAGGVVVDAVSLAAAKGGTSLAIRPRTVVELDTKFGRENLEEAIREFGIDFTLDALTESDGQYLLRSGSLDSLRNRLAQAQNALLARGLGPAAPAQARVIQPSELTPAQAQGPKPSLHPETGLELNADGTVTLYHHTSAEAAAGIVAEGRLRSEAEPRVYVTTESRPITGYGDTVVEVRVDPASLELDDQFPDGRQDFGIPAPETGVQVRASMYQEPKPGALYQPEGEVKRGRISFGPNREVDIEFLRHADVSTYLHEMGHLFLKVLGDVAAEPGASEAVKADLATALEYLGVKSIDEVGTEQQEKWAKSIELYVMKNEAPSLSLRSTFERLSAWLKSVYQKMVEYFAGIELTPEVTELFNKMFASEADVAEAEAAEGFGALIGKAEGVLSPTDAAAYEEARSKLRKQAEGTIRTRLLRKLEKRRRLDYRRARARVRREVEEQVRQRKIYNAISILARGKNADGSPLPDGVQPFKLDRADVASKFGDLALKNLPPFTSAAEGGVPVSVAAEMLGYENGAALMQALQAPSMGSVIEAETDARMIEEGFEEPEITEADQELVDEAIHNEHLAELLHLELELMAKNKLPLLKRIVQRVALPLPSRAAVRQEAAELLRKKPLGKIKPHLYLRVSKVKAREAMQALVRGDFDAAFEAKKQQLLNVELYRAARERWDKVEKFQQWSKRLWQSDKKISENRLMDYVMAARHVMAEFGLGRDVENVKAYLDKLRAYDPDGAATLEELMAAALERKGDYLEVTGEVFDNMEKCVRAYWKMARRGREMLIKGKTVTLGEASDACVEQLQKVLGDKVLKAKFAGARTTWETFTRYIKGIRSSLRRVEQFVEALDTAFGGPFRTFIYDPIRKATDAYRLQKKEVLLRYKAILDRVKPYLGDKAIDASELGTTFKNIQYLLGALLHTGNESNLSKLLRGRGWGTKLEDGTLDTTNWDKFVRRMIDEGVLRKEHFEFCQQVWDLCESMKPDAQRAYHRMYGTFFNEVTAQSFEVVFPSGEKVTYRGGYVPARVDSFEVQHAAVREEQESLERMNNSFMLPTTGRGFTYSRVENYAAALSIDLSLVSGHIDAVMRFVHIEPAVKDVRRLLVHGPLRAALDAYDPTICSDMLVPFLQRAATQQIKERSKFTGGRAADRFFSAARSRAGMQIMFSNLANTIQNVTGLSLALLKVAPKHFLRNGIWKFVRAPRDCAKMITDKSRFMATRMSTQMMEIEQSIERIIVAPNAFETTRDFFMRHTYFMQMATQNVVDNVVWLAAYEQACETMDEAAAVEYADSAVRQTQGSYDPEDMSRLETSTPLVRFFLMFSGYFNMQANTVATEFLKAVRTMGFKNAAPRLLYVYTFGFMIPAVLGDLVMDLVAGSPDEPDDDDDYMWEYISYFFASQYRTLMAMFPGVGPAVATIGNFWDDRAWNDRITASPAMRTLEATTRGLSGVSTVRAIKGEGRASTAIRDLLTALGMLTGLPTAPLAKPTGYLADVAQGYTDEQSATDMLRGLISGRAPKR